MTNPSQAFLENINSLIYKVKYTNDSVETKDEEAEDPQERMPSVALQIE